MVRRILSDNHCRVFLGGAVANAKFKSMVSCMVDGMFSSMVRGMAIDMVDDMVSDVASDREICRVLWEVL